MVAAGLVAIAVATLAPAASAQPTASTVAGRAALAAAAGSSAATPPPGSTGVYFEVLPSPTGSPTPDPQPTPHPTEPPHPTWQPTPHPSRQPLPVTGSDSGPGPMLALAALLIAVGGILGVLGRRRVR
ncbi:hypothetical protein [Verrucosispora sp. TAA-831]|uniref:hypothetical protein n=1 Tax=Verrucosispora sp. TAA-831 TaxID=3422227 RepID=UPI003D6FBC77